MLSGNLLIHVFRSSIIDLHGFPSQACTAWFSAAICKHVYFSLRTANMCDFLLQREQDAMLPLILSHPMFLREIGSRQTKKRAALSFCLCWQDWLEDDFFLFNVSLTRQSCRSGSIPPLEIIPHGKFYRIRMHFPDGNHPARKFPANQDAFLRRKSSRPEISSKSGCISPTEIIPHRLFQQIRMHFLVGNHPSKTFPANQDAFPQRKSSRPEIFSKSGCISPLKIIPHGHFQQIRMHFSNRNHPSRKFSANQDAFLR